MMFYEWVSAGVAFGIKAFFAVFVFLLCLAVVMTALGLIAKAFGGEE